MTIFIPPLGEWNGRPSDVTVRLEERHHDTGTDRHRAVPGAVLSGEDCALIFCREHVTRVEHETQVSSMGDLFDFWKYDVSRRLLILVFDGARMPAAIPREAEVLPYLGDVVHLSRGNIVTHAVDLVVIAPQRLVLRIEIHANWVPQLQINLQHKSADQGALADRTNSAGTVAYLSPGISATLGKNIQAYAFVQVPVYSQLSGYQLFPGWTGTVGLSVAL